MEEDEVTPEQQVPTAEAQEARRLADVNRGGTRWAWGIGIAIVAVIGLCAIRGAQASDDPADLTGDAKRACQEDFIPQRLKAPATAKFTGVSAHQVGDSYEVTGSVDSENAFGAKVRAGFSCTMHSSGGSWVLDSAQVQG